MIPNRVALDSRAQASNHLMGLDTPKFEQVLDAMVLSRIGVLLKSVGVNCTVTEALVGKSVHEKKVLLTEDEIKVVRARCGMTLIRKKQLMANATLETVRLSLLRIGAADDLRELGIRVSSAKDTFNKWHIIFVQVP